MRTLHTIGDSHSGSDENISWRTINIKGLNIVEHWLGPVTCASFGFKKKELIDVSAFAEDGDFVCFCFGEIDCRTHIHKDHDIYKDIIDKIVENYFSAIQVTTNHQMRVMVMSVPPISHRCHEFCDHPYPMVGTDDERRQYVLYFNSQLKKYCNIYDYVYFDVYTDYCGEDGYMIKELSDGLVHIENSKFMKQRLIEIL